MACPQTWHWRLSIPYCIKVNSTWSTKAEFANEDDLKLHHLPFTVALCFEVVVPPVTHWRTRWNTEEMGWKGFAHTADLVIATPTSIVLRNRALCLNRALISLKHHAMVNTKVVCHHQTAKQIPAYDYGNPQKNISKQEPMFTTLRIRFTKESAKNSSAIFSTTLILPTHGEPLKAC